MFDYDAALKLILKGSARVMIRTLCGFAIKRWHDGELFRTANPAPHDSTEVVELKRQLQWALLKIQVLEERLRLIRIQKYGPGSEKLNDAQLEVQRPSTTVSAERHSGAGDGRGDQPGDAGRLGDAGGGCRQLPRRLSDQRVSAQFRTPGFSQSPSSVPASSLNRGAEQFGQSRSKKGDRRCRAQSRD